MRNLSYENIFKLEKVQKEKSFEREGRAARDLKASIDYICTKSLERTEHPLSLIEMEQMSGYSRRSLINAFQSRYGCSPCKWQQSERLRIAQHLLLTGERNLKIGTLAWKLGFSSASKFCSYYRRMFKETPKQTLKRSYKAAA